MGIYFNDIEGKGRAFHFNFSEFKQFYVGTHNSYDSNRFIRSLFNQIDEAICPKNYNDCPMYYLGTNYKEGSKSVVFLCSLKTSIGFVFILVSYKRKGHIDNVHFMVRGFNHYNVLDDEKLKEYYGILKGLVRKAIGNIDTYTVFVSSYSVLGRNSFGHNLILSEYKGKNFIVDNGTFSFYVEGYNLKDCKAISEKIMKIIVDFLAVETNTLFDYKLVDLNTKNVIEEFDRPKSYYQEDLKIDDIGEIGEEFYKDGIYIDYFPSHESKILLSKQGVKYIDYIINDFGSYDTNNGTFLNACFLYRDSLLEMMKIERIPIKYFGTHMLFKVKNNNFENMILSNSLLYCISSLEVVTCNSQNFERCEHCGQVRYTISKRVYDFMRLYTTNFVATAFKRAYDLRSRYIHQGNVYSNMHKVDTYPMIDMGTASGFEEQGFGVMIDGHSLNFPLDYFEEWTSFALRKYYKKLLVEKN